MDVARGDDFFLTTVTCIHTTSRHSPACADCDATSPIAIKTLLSCYSASISLGTWLLLYTISIRVCVCACVRVFLSRKKSSVYSTFAPSTMNSLLSHLVLLISLLLVLNGGKTKSQAEAGLLYGFIHDLVQYNVAGVPSIHEKTEWSFDPELGQKRRERYEYENGRKGEIAIEKLGMGIGYQGPWGVPVKESTNHIQS